MKAIRRTIVGIVFLLLVGAGVAGTYVYYVWNRSDELLRKVAHEKLNEIAQGWNISVRSAHFDFQGQVHLYDVVVPGDDPDRPILEAPEVVLSFDPDTLADPQPKIRHVQVIQPRASLHRDAEGHWAFLQLPPLRHPLSVVPEFHWERAVVLLQPGRGGSQHTGEPLRFEQVDVRMIPSGKRQFVIKAAATVPGVDELSCEGKWNLEDRAWSVAGRARNLRLDRRLLDLATELAPQSQDCVDRIEAAIEQWDQNQSQGLPADQQATAADRRQPVVFSAIADVQYRLARWQPDAAVEYQCQLDVLQGELRHPRIPYPFRDLRGQIAIENHEVLLRELSAKSDATHFRIENGRVREEEGLRPAEFDIIVTDLPFDDRLYRVIPVESRRVYDSIRPGGLFDARLHFEFNGHDRWEHDGDVTVRDGTATHTSFPYRIDRINGTIKRTGDLLELALTGQSGPHTIGLRGRVKNPGPEAAALFDIEATGLPIDEKLRAACRPKVREMVDRLGLQGELDGRLRLSRPAGLNQPITTYIKGRLHHGAINARDFSYPVSDVTGQFEGTLENWDFTGFQGRQGAAELTWSGAVRTDDERIPHMQLKFDAVNAVCDRVLYSALPADWKEIWVQLNPQGVLRAAGKIEWTAGAPLDVMLDAELREGRLEVKSFPLPLADVRADVSFDKRRVTIKSISGRHDEMSFRATGFVDFPGPGEWRLHLADMHVDDLVADHSLRKALPGRLLAIIEAFNPRGKLSIKGILDFRGKKGDAEEFPVTAAWDTETIYTGNTLTAGVDLRDMHGKSHFLGTWDGESVSGKGRINLQTVKVFGFELTDVSGPVSIDKDQLIVGTKPSGGLGLKKGYDKAAHLTGRFIEGVLGLDAEVLLGEKMRYYTRITLSDGELKRYAQSYMSGPHKLAGRMNGFVELNGEGADPKRLNGSGGLTISKAALYELPMIVAIFQTLALTRPADAAFDQAQFDFGIRNSTVSFGRIDLVGDAVRLIGRGRVKFSGAVDLDFYSTAGRNQLAIPIVRELINVGTTGLVRVKVGGTVKQPDARMTPLPQIDATLRQLLGAFEPRGPARR